MKTVVTLCLEPELLENVRRFARPDNRTQTNFVETALKERVERIAGGRGWSEQVRASSTARHASDHTS